MIIGIISDTHGLLREEAIRNLKDCNLIIHAGDIGRLGVIKELENICTVEYIKGNCDKSDEMKNIDKIKIIEVETKKMCIIHNIKDIKDIKNINILIYGHSHKKELYTKDGVLYINPGSIGPKRFNLPVTMAKLHVSNNHVSESDVEFIEIE